MSLYRLSPMAEGQVADIYGYTHAEWGADQADRYYNTLFDCFDAIADRRVAWRQISPAFGIGGWFCRCAHHFVYWRQKISGEIEVVAIVHERMHQMEQLRAAWEA
ncbi:type II toxin-antitoxin system RelE/ParE family toxin [Sphingomonas hengshuiensis]|uniref:Type II toxin-antitoxin system RelE/ParE family toxin n=1 Tax=Sphingomonas hengshuiensis TaxID=1609977 RepID=A0A7U4J9F1_9SPHN|nr:type II toxin-antitoxin system RelE/ParE family toxin [Sphingomonas hengshuiensis]AJP72653.1 hypothetical protein TS85_14010 [Sphingomonas hengshuiensis]